jgi:type VI secretion system secreted protein Hcp
VAIFMKYGSFNGDATLAGFEGWINISDFKWQVIRSITTRSGSQGNTYDPKQQPDIHTITVKKETDSATAPLLDAMCNKNKAEKCTIVFVRTGDSGQAYLQYKLSNALLANYKIDLDSKEENIVETLEINFTKVEMAHLSSDETNVLSQSEPDRFEFDKLTAPGQSPPSRSGPAGGHP